jgi:DHA3 family macrolide efflux protein-like MFS transporter
METKEQDRRAWKGAFFTIWGGQQLSLIGSGVAQFALVWWLTETSDSATVLALGTAISLLPQVLLGPLAGALVDRWSRRAVMLVADTGIALASLWLAWLFWADTVHYWHVYILMLVRALGTIFHWPAMMASTSLMVPEKHLSRVAGLNESIRGALNIVAPPLGALLLGILPIQGILGIDVVTAAFAITPLAFTRVPQPERAAVEGEDEVSLARKVVRDVREGLRYVRGWPGLSALLGMAAFTYLIGAPAFYLVPILIKQHFGGASIEVGWAISAFGVGVVLGGLLLGVWGGFRRRIVTMLTGWAGMAVATIVIGLSPPTALWIGMIGFFLAGLMTPIGNGTSMALLQAVVAPEMQGRVLSLILSVSSAMAPLGLAIAGPFADTFGIESWYVMAGVLPIMMIVGAFCMPSIMSIGDANASPPDHGQAVPATASSEDM